MLQHRELGRGQRRQLVFAAPPADVGIAAQRAEPGAGRVHQHAVEHGGERQRLEQVGLHDADIGGAARAHRAPQQIDAPIADVAGHQQAAAVHERGERRGLAAGRRAGVEHARQRPIAGQQRHQLRCLVLHHEPALLQARRRGAGGLRRRSAPSGAKRSGAPEFSASTSGRSERLTIAGETFASASRVVLSRLARSVTGAGRVVELHPRFGGVETESIEPALGQPAGMRQGDAQVFQRRVAFGRHPPAAAAAAARRGAARSIAAPRSRSRSRCVCPSAWSGRPHRRRRPRPARG